MGGLGGGGSRSRACVDFRLQLRFGGDGRLGPGRLGRLGQKASREENCRCCSVARSVVTDSATPWTAARQASLSFTISQSLVKLMSNESVMPRRRVGHPNPGRDRTATQSEPPPPSGLLPTHGPRPHTQAPPSFSSSGSAPLSGPSFSPSASGHIPALAPQLHLSASGLYFARF